MAKSKSVGKLRLIDIVDGEMKTMIADSAPSGQVQSWTRMSEHPFHFSYPQNPDEATLRFLGQRSEFPQLALLRDWLSVSVGMPDIIDKYIDTALRNAVTEARGKMRAQNVASYLVTALIALLIGAGLASVLTYIAMKH